MEEIQDQLFIRSLSHDLQGVKRIQPVVVLGFLPLTVMLAARLRNLPGDGWNAVGSVLGCKSWPERLGDCDLHLAVQTPEEYFDIWHCFWNIVMNLDMK